MSHRNPAPTEVAALLGSGEWRALLAHRPSFNLFDAFSLTLRENPSSRALALLLSTSEDHGLGNRLLNHWLDELVLDLLAGRARTSEPKRTRVIQLLGRLRAPVTQAVTEWGTVEGKRLDVLLYCRNHDGGVSGILGIENKHWAREPEGQVGHYQGAVAQRWPHLQDAKLLLYLTPYGSRPRTGDSNPDCPWLAASYSTVLRAMRVAESGATPSTALLLHDLRNHLAKEFEMPEESDHNEVKQLVESLWAHPGHRKVLEWIREFTPTVRTLATRLLERIEPRFRDMDLEQPSPELRPVRGQKLRELQWYPFKEDASLGEKVWPCLLLAPDDDEEHWAVDSRIRAAWMLWMKGVEGADRQKRALKSAGVKQLPDPRLAQTWTRSKWVPVWLGSRTYTLTGDFLDKDLSGLEHLVVEALENTPPGWKERLSLREDR